MEPETPPNRSVTPRGFTTYDEFTDTYGSKVVVRESSGAAGPRVWIFADYPDGPEQHLTPGDRQRLARFDIGELAARLTPSPHLDVEQARRVRDALDAFIKERGTDGT